MTSKTVHSDTAVTTASDPATETTFRVLVTPRDPAHDGHGRGLVAAAQQLGYSAMTGCVSGRLFFLHGRMTSAEAYRIGYELLADPVTEQLAITDLRADRPELPQTGHLLEVTLLPGVTDPPADNLLRTARLLGIAGLQRAATGQSYLLSGNFAPETLRALAVELFANPVIQRFAIDAAITAPFFAYETADATVETIPVTDADDARLLAISRERRLSLDLPEMQAIRAYYRDEQREPTDIELEMLAQTWSEHCVHKTFRATIDYVGPATGAPHDTQPVAQRIDGLLKTYLRAATETVNRPWVHSAFVDNAGIVAFDDTYDLAFKVETHNHPSALEPFGGANTGIGGVVRDVLGVSARPIANTDVLCFGPPDMDHDSVPEGVLHPRRIADGVVAGIEDYGNKMGIPTVNGSLHYHPGYTANPLVYCGCLGILPRGANPTQVQPGDLIVAVGGRTGRDGLRGATFSSMEMDVATSDIAGTAVQIGNPIMEKQVQEAILRARDEGLYNAITDCGAGGFSSAVGEMGAEVGARVQLLNVTLKYPGLRPWEIWLSEAQERMVLAVPPAKWARLQAVCAGQDVEAIVLGVFEPTGRLTLAYGERIVGDLAMDFLHDGIPTKQLTAEWLPADGLMEINPHATLTPQAALLALLAHPDIRSKEDVVRRYDHEVQGGTAVKPLVGVANHGPSDAAVVVPQASQPAAAGSQEQVRGAALSNGICPNYTDLDPYAMAWAAVDEAFRNAVAVGADPDQVSILDNFCWGNPTLPDRLGALVRCAQGCYDAAVAYNAPFISGKDSLYNEYTGGDGEKHAIPGTLLISALALVPDVGKTVTMDLKRAGNFVFIVGDTRSELGGSHLAQVGGRVREQHWNVPQPVPDALARYKRLHAAMQAGLVQAAHDCADGGIGVALAEMCIAGRVGLDVQLTYAPRDEYWAYSADDAILFSESQGRLLVEVHPEHVDALHAALDGVPHACIGVVGGDRLVIHGRGDLPAPLVDLPIATLEQAWRGHLADAGSQPDWTMSQSRPGTRPDGERAAPVVVLQPTVLILHANGTNRDHDAALACRLAGGDPEIVHINQLLSGERDLLDYHMLVVPGGFSYGDDLGAGVLWAADLRHRLGDALRRFVSDGRPVLGICNGFQALVKAGILPGQPFSSPAPEEGKGGRAVTLTFNDSARFECRWTMLRPNPASVSLFTQGLEDLIYCPVAHGEGRVAVRYTAVAEELDKRGMIALTYVAADGTAVGYPDNPNGSVFDIAGLCNAQGNVLGLMPHPENHIFAWQHPRGRRGERGLSGLRLFENGIKHA